MFRKIQKILENWRISKTRKPLILQGARQVGKTFIVFDEVQLCERALTSLKYFCEQANEYHVIVAGSLLGVAVNRKTFSFPVGKVDIDEYWRKCSACQL